MDGFLGLFMIFTWFRKLDLHTCGFSKVLGPSFSLVAFWLDCASSYVSPLAVGGRNILIGQTEHETRAFPAMRFPRNRCPDSQWGLPWNILHF